MKRGRYSILKLLVLVVLLFASSARAAECPYLIPSQCVCDEGFLGNCNANFCTKHSTSDRCLRNPQCYWRDTKAQNALCIKTYLDFYPKRVETFFEKKEDDITVFAVYVAIGYGRSNIVILEGTSQKVVIDTGESIPLAEEVKQELEN